MTDSSLDQTESVHIRMRAALIGETGVEFDARCDEDPDFRRRGSLEDVKNYTLGYFHTQEIVFCDTELGEW